MILWRPTCGSWGRNFLQPASRHSQCSYCKNLTQSDQQRMMTTFVSDLVDEDFKVILAPSPVCSCCLVDSPVGEHHHHEGQVERDGAVSIHQMAWHDLQGFIQKYVVHYNYYHRKKFDFANIFQTLKMRSRVHVRPSLLFVFLSFCLSWEVVLVPFSAMETKQCWRMG